MLTLGLQRSSDNETSSSSSTSGDDDDEEDDSCGMEERSDDEGADNPSGTNALVQSKTPKQARAELKAKRKAENADLKKLVDERTSRKVRLNDLTAISGPRVNAQQEELFKTMKCHKCGEMGHKERHCPSSGKGWREEYLKLMKCYECGKTGHMARDCPIKENAQRDEYLKMMKCRDCGKTGHMASDCPSKGNAKRSRNNREANH